MRRREFILALGGAAAWPLVSGAQQSTMPVVGFLNSTSPGPWARYVDAFRSLDVPPSLSAQVDETID
jgi:putative ABC transport system substrate-binding protein